MGNITHIVTHIGLDVHKDTIVVASLRLGGTACEERVIPNTPRSHSGLATFYNSKRGHSALGGHAPADAYFTAFPRRHDHTSAGLNYVR
jgi:hypothetical protein